MLWTLCSLQTENGTERGRQTGTATLWVMCCCSAGAWPLGSIRVGWATRYPRSSMMKHLHTASRYMHIFIHKHSGFHCCQNTQSPALFMLLCPRRLPKISVNYCSHWSSASTPLPNTEPPNFTTTTTTTTPHYSLSRLILINTAPGHLHKDTVRGWRKEKEKRAWENDEWEREIRWVFKRSWSLVG